jgi:hypothetical protein
MTSDYSKLLERQWRSAGDNLFQAVCVGFTFTIKRKVNYERAYPAMVYDYVASVVRGTPMDDARVIGAAERIDLDTHTDPKAALDRCAEYLNSTIQQQKR